MAISTPGDIVLDVVRAADPAAAETARSRLAAFVERTRQAEFSEVATTRQSPPAPASAPEAFAKFEAMVLQTFIQSMLPKDTESVYGKGMAGEMWQAMLAEQLGEVMASRGGIGIASRVLADRYVDGERTVPLQGVSSGPEKAELDTQRMLSVALVQEIQRKTALALNEDRAASSITSR